MIMPYNDILLNALLDLRLSIQKVGFFVLDVLELILLGSICKLPLLFEVRTDYGL